MSEVLRRTIYMAQDRDSPETGTPIRTADWASVTTALGQMWEPFVPFQKRGVGEAISIPNYDFSESMHRVDRVEFVTMQTFHTMMNTNASGSPVMGGNLYPRVGA